MQEPGAASRSILKEPRRTFDASFDALNPARQMIHHAADERPHPVALGQVDHTADLGLERLADVVEQIGQRAVIGCLRDGRPRRADIAQFAKSSSLR